MVRLGLRALSKRLMVFRLEFEKSPLLLLIIASLVSARNLKSRRLKGSMNTNEPQSKLLKGGLYRGLYREQLQGLLRGILGV